MRKIQLTKQAIYADSISTALYLRDISKIQFLESNSSNIESFSSREHFERHLVHIHLKFAAQVAIRYGGMGLEKEDLISIANIGLIRASKLFDPNYGVKFISFSVNYIRAEITKALNELSRTVRIPSHKINQVNYASYSLDQELENDDNCTTYSDRYVRCEMNESCFDSKFVKDEIQKALNFLHPNTRIAIQMYYAIGHEYEYSMEDIAHVIGVSTERVRQIIRKAEIQLKASFLRYL